MKIATNTLTIGGFVSGDDGKGNSSGKQSVENFGRYLITFFGNPDITALSVAGLPGYPSPATGTGTATGTGGGFPGGFPGGGGPRAGSFVPTSGGAPIPGGDGIPGGDPGSSAALGQLPGRPGFPFTATATLKRSVTAPTIPASAGGGTSTTGGVPGGPVGTIGPPPSAPVDAPGAPVGDAPPSP